MRMYDIIAKKRDGDVLSEEEISYFVSGVTSGEIPDYETTALLMAIYLRGMTDEECATLTDKMAHSGDIVDLSRFGDLSCDKHSSGGVGDKTSLIVAPIVASLGGVVAKMSGRGLGHTGGTVDKLEAIPGYSTSLSTADFFAQAEKVGLALVGQSGNLTPADKKIYALRDVTATVSSIPLIASSIMSKKLAAGSKNIVLDVKVGSGAFMKTVEEAEKLATAMVNIGTSCGRRVTAVISNMDEPLGRAVGNSVEVIEAIDVLTGKVRGPLRDLCITLAREMICQTMGLSEDEAEAKVSDALDSGAALAKMREWIGVQGGDVRFVDDTALFPVAQYKREVKSPCDGYVFRINAEGIGSACSILGAGRTKKEDVIDHAAGIMMSCSVGDRVSVGDTLLTLLTNSEAALADAERRVLESIVISEDKPRKTPLVHKVIRQ